MANASKAKGYRGEVEVMALLQAVVNEVYQEKGLAPVELSRAPHGRDIVGLPWLAPEVKRVEGDHPSLVAGFWAQCKDQATRAGTNREPVLFHRLNNRPWKVRMFGFLALPDNRPECPKCGGKGKHPVMNFSPGHQYHEVSCASCHGRGTLDPAPQPRVRCPVDISIEAFLTYLKIRIRQELDSVVTL